MRGSRVLSMLSALSIVIVGALTAAPLAAQGAASKPPVGSSSKSSSAKNPSVPHPAAAADDQTLEQIRREVWVAWFAGDTARLRQILAPELIAISPDDAAMRGLDETLSGSAAYARSGGRLVSLSFDQKTTQRIGDAAVMFSRYRMELENGGKRSVTRGRATEVFVKRGGKWVHTSWHLDQIP